MIEFLRKLFGAPGSSATAKDRLRLVLMTDHLSLAPEMIEQMKADFIDVISKYVEVDRDKIEVNFEEHDRALAMLANVPILAVNRPSGGNTTQDETPKEAEPVAAALIDAPQAEETSDAAPALPRRKRRKKSGNRNSGPQATPAPAT